MKVAVLITLAFALANGSTVGGRYWGYSPIGSGFYGNMDIQNRRMQYGGSLLQDMPFEQSKGMMNPWWCGDRCKTQFEGVWSDTQQQQEMKQILFETEQLLKQQQYDVDQAKNLIWPMCDRIVEKLQELEETRFQQVIKQVVYGSVQQIAKDEAATILKEIMIKTVSQKMTGFQNNQKESLKETLKAAFMVQMLQQKMQPMTEKTNFWKEVEQILEQTFYYDIERAVDECQRKLKQIQDEIQLLKQQWQKIKFFQVTTGQQTDIAETLEVVKQEVFQKLQQLKIYELACRMACAGLQKLMVQQQYDMQQITLEQIRPDMMRDDVKMLMMP